MQLVFAGRSTYLKSIRVNERNDSQESNSRIYKKNFDSEIG